MSVGDEGLKRQSEDVGVQRARAAFDGCGKASLAI
jgi:hypothetical protein